MQATCPKCGSEQFYYVQSVTELHTMEEIGTEDDDYIDLSSLVESYPDDSCYRLECYNPKCGWSGNKSDYIAEKEKE